MALTVDFYTSFKCSGRTPEILGAIENVRRMVGQKMPQDIQFHRFQIYTTNI